MSPHAVLAAPALVAIGGDGIGTGRTVPTIAAAMGLISVIVAGRAFTRGRAGVSRRGGVVALVLGSITAAVGGAHAANAAGGLGTGNGLAGAVVALALGLIGALLAGMVLARARRAARDGRSA